MPSHGHASELALTIEVQTSFGIVARPNYVERTVWKPHRPFLAIAGLMLLRFTLNVTMVWPGK